jgi:hypothetical protein
MHGDIFNGMTNPCAHLVLLLLGQPRLALHLLRVRGPGRHPPPATPLCCQAPSA